MCFLGLALLALALSFDLVRIYSAWPFDPRGWEYEDVAQAWADGEGFRVLGEHAWYQNQSDPGAYYPTAWVEPLPTVLLGGFLRWLGEQGRLAMVVANVLLFAATLAVVYQLGKRLGGPFLGLASASLLALIPAAHTVVKVYIGNAVLGGLLVSVCALLLLWCLEDGSARRGLALGAAIGITALTQAATIVFVPVAAAIVLLSTGPFTWRGWWCAAVVAGTALLVISPWTLRNQMTFGELVLVRNGGGHIAYVGNRGLAEALDPSLRPEDAPVALPWTADSFLHAVQLLDDLEARRALWRYSLATVRAMAPLGYAGFNEAERDRLFSRNAVDFIRQHPLTTAQLMVVKAARFVFQTGDGWANLIATSVVALLAIGAAAGSLRDRRVAALALMAAAYASVYVLTYPHYYRYRYPIEPIIAVLGGIALVWLVQLGWRTWRRLAVPRREADAVPLS